MEKSKVESEKSKVQSKVENEKSKVEKWDGGMDWINLA